MELPSKIAFALFSPLILFCDKLHPTLQNVGGKIATASDPIYAAAAERHDVRSRRQ